MLLSQIVRLTCQTMSQKESDCGLIDLVDVLKLVFQL